MTGLAAVTIDQIDQAHTAALLVDELGYERARDLAIAILDIVDPGWDNQDEEEEEEDDWRCRNCPEPLPCTEAFMVNDAAWPGSHRGYLHVVCLEAALGRQLRPEDFTDCPLNMGALVNGPLLLRQRMTGLEDPGFLEPAEYQRWLSAWLNDRHAGA